MLRFFIALLTILFMVLMLGQNAKAQIKPAQSQYLKETGFLVNPGFEQGYKGWTIGGDCSKSLVSEVPYFNRSLKITCVAQTFSIKQETTQVDLAGQQGVFGLQIKVNFDGTKIAELPGGARSTTELNINSLANYQRISAIPYIVNPTSNGVEIYSDSPVTGELIIDNVSLTLAPNGFITEDLDDVPIGTVLAHGSEIVPSGYLLADGACYSKSGDYSQLFDIIGITGGECDSGAGAGSGFNIPDLRNTFLRGLTGGRTVFDSQADATDDNGLNGTTDNDTHFHQIYSSNTSTTNSDVRTVAAGRNFGATVVSSSNGYRSTFGSGGAQAIQNDTHNHSLNIGSSDSETRPANKAVVYIIKAIGRPPRNIITQKSFSPEKAGFIYWSAFDTDIEGFLPADGRCILESAYPEFIANTGADTFGDCTVNVASDGSRLPNIVDGNRYIRASGGGLTLGQLQDDATAVNGLATATDGSHSHTLNNNADASPNGTTDNLLPPMSGNGAGVTATSTVAIQSSGNHTHTITSSDSETRPISIALTPYIRMVDSDLIKGSLVQVEQNKNDISTLQSDLTSDEGDLQDLKDRFVFAHATSNSGQTCINSSPNRIEFEDEAEDTNGYYNPGNGRFQVTNSADYGWYECCAKIKTANQDIESAGDDAQLELWKNDSVYRELDNQEADDPNGAKNWGLSGCAPVFLGSGNYVDVRAVHDDAATACTGAGHENYFYCIKINENNEL